MAPAVKWGIISTADINRKLIPGAHASPKVELVAVASRDKDARRGLRDASGRSSAPTARTTSCSPIPTSRPSTTRCRTRCTRSGRSRRSTPGKHVLCEKPFSRHTEEVEASFDAAERNDRLLSEAFMYRHNPQTARLKELVDDGAIGELRLVRSAFSYSLYDADEHPPAHGRRGRRADGRRLLLRQRLAPARRRARERLRQRWFGETGTDWVFTATMRFPGDVLAMFDCGTALAERDELEAIGSEGSLFLDDPWHCNEPVIEVRRDGRDRADRARAGGLVPPRAREPERRDPRRGRAAARARGRASRRRARSRRCTSRPRQGRPVSL